MPRMRKPTLRFRTEDPAALRQDLEQFSDWVDKFTKQLYYDFQHRVRFRGGVVVSGSVTAGHWEGVFVGPPDGVTVNVELPKPQASESGAVCTVVKTTSTGTVKVYAGGSDIDADTVFTLTANPGLHNFTLDGSGYWAHGEGV